MEDALALATSVRAACRADDTVRASDLMGRIVRDHVRYTDATRSSLVAALAETLNALHEPSLVALAFCALAHATARVEPIPIAACLVAARRHRASALASAAFLRLAVEHVAVAPLEDLPELAERASALALAHPTNEDVHHYAGQLFVTWLSYDEEDVRHVHGAAGVVALRAAASQMVTCSTQHVTLLVHGWPWQDWCRHHILAPLRARA